MGDSDYSDDEEEYYGAEAAYTLSSGKHKVTPRDASRIQSTQAKGGKDMSSRGFASRAQSAGARNANAEWAAEAASRQESTPIIESPSDSGSDDSRDQHDEKAGGRNGDGLDALRDTFADVSLLEEEEEGSDSEDDEEYEAVMGLMEATSDGDGRDDAKGRKEFDEGEGGFYDEGGNVEDYDPYDDGDMYGEDDDGYGEDGYDDGF
ncbi:hypothetical protein BDY24DRAFT_384430 [Mrakia frigida]|uniref:uncharacterized protein n=1 Tax=Mrakia frigida TaxID=29902 RepID=UPI003FCC23E9